MKNIKKKKRVKLTEKSVLTSFHAQHPTAGQNTQQGCLFNDKVKLVYQFLVTKMRKYKL